MAGATAAAFCAAAGLPWVMLSAGVTPPQFLRVMEYAYAAGANGFLAGRAVWWEALQSFPDLDACRAALELDGPRRWIAFTTRATTLLPDVRFEARDVLVFGCETSGLPESIVERFATERRVRIPMRPGMRSLNLSNAVAVAVYEAWRQLGYAGAAR